MRLFLEIIEGPDKGQQINLKKSTSFGRKDAEIIFNDPKLSGIHGLFKFDPASGWALIDQESRNGIWVKGIREQNIPIYDGMEFQIGQTTILCRIIIKSTKKVEGGFVQWLNLVTKLLKNSKNQLQEIKPEMRLKTVQGLQYGHFWDVFFGPRVVGKEQMDICIYEESAPEEAFEILVKKRYPYFHTKHPDIVKLNGESISDKQLIPGDTIQIGDSKFLVEFDNGHGFSS